MRPQRKHTINLVLLVENILMLKLMLVLYDFMYTRPKKAYPKWNLDAPYPKDVGVCLLHMYGTLCPSSILDIVPLGAQGSSGRKA